MSAHQVTGAGTGLDHGSEARGTSTKTSPSITLFSKSVRGRATVEHYHGISFFETFRTYS